MVDALPLSLIAISAMYTFRSFCLLRDIMKTMTTDSLQNLTLCAIVEVSCYQNLGLRRNGIDRIHSLTKTIGSSLTERTTITLTTKTTGQMNHKHMERIT